MAMSRQPSVTEYEFQSSIQERWSVKKELLSEFFKLLDKEEVGEHLLKHSDLVMVWARIAHYCGRSYPLPSEVKLNTIRESTKSEITSVARPKFGCTTFHRIQYAMKHATLIYPPWMLAAMGSVSNSEFERISVRYLGETFPSRVLTDIVFPHIQHSHIQVPIDATRIRPMPSMLQIKEDRYLRERLGGIDHDDDGSGLPYYYVAIDTKEHAVVVCIRGTSCFEDVVTDLNCKGAYINDPQTPLDGSPPMKGRAHAGIWRGAYWVTVAIREKVKDLLAKYPDYRLVITGHSLGAGTASLLGFIWGRLDGKYALCENPSQRIDCIPFASPCILDENLANACKDYIMSVALGTDMVTRVGLSSIRLLCDRVDVIMKCRQDSPIVYGEALKVLYPGEDDTKLPEISDGVRDFFDEVVGKEFDVSDNEVPLYPCGRFLWFVPDICVNGKSDNEVRLTLLKGQHIFNKPLFISSAITQAFDKATAEANGLDKIRHLYNSGIPDTWANAPMKYTLCEATAMKSVLPNLLFDESFNSIFVHIVSAYHRSLNMNTIED